MLAMSIQRSYMWHNSRQIIFFEFEITIYSPGRLATSSDAKINIEQIMIAAQIEKVKS